jgi:hypothetical protein
VERAIWVWIVKECNGTDTNSTVRLMCIAILQESMEDQAADPFARLIGDNL